MSRMDRMAYFLATGCYIGRMPVAPGTFGSLPGILIAALLAGVPIHWAAFLCGGLVIGAIWVADRTAKLLQSGDPGCVVIDEIAGMTLTLLALPVRLDVVIAGFCAFRLLDIFKPFPVGYLDRHLRGGMGIVMDDLAAGAIGNGILRVALYLGWIGS